MINVIFFNQPYLKPKLAIGETVTVTGKWDRHRQTITGSECHVGDQSREKEFEPVYSVREIITVKGIRRFISNAFSEYGTMIEENLPPQLLATYKLMPRNDALRTMHFPQSANEM